MHRTHPDVRWRRLYL